MNQSIKWIAAGLTIAAVTSQVVSFRAIAADAPSVIKEAMKNYHKAPKGVDTVSQKAIAGKATPEEIKKLIAGYRDMTTAKPPQGDDASWKEKTAKVLTAAEGLEKGTAEAQAKYKDAANCKACHSVHKPPQ